MPTCSPAPPATATERPTLCGVLCLDVCRGAPVLSLVIRCPACRCPHVHSSGYDPALPPGCFPVSATHRVAHCHRESSPYRGPGRGYYVAPVDDAANAGVLARYVKLMREADTLIP